MQETARADALAKKLSTKDMTSFWKSIKAMNNKNIMLASSVNGVTGQHEISEMWREHYSGILNCVHNETNKGRVESVLNTISKTDRYVIQPHDISDAISNLKHGKSVGYDLLAAEHYVYADYTLHVLLSLLFTSFLLHGHLPNDFMRTIVVPLITSKTGNLSDKNNYRPIALVTISSKIIELVFLNHIESYIETGDNQFGFKRKHGTDLCIYSLKNVINYYRHHQSPVFTCFLDASRAFDRVNFWSLFTKLIKRGVPILIVRLLSFWYNTQEFCVKWGMSTSVFFTTTNGVRQGGILSPKLFAVYIDDLSMVLNALKVGCYIDFTCVNHLFYADDMCLLAPSALGLQLLVNVCEHYGFKHDILYNPAKSQCMIVPPKHYNLIIPSITLNGNQLQYTDTVKYLGVLLSSSFKDDCDIQRQLRSLYASGNTIMTKFAHCTLSVKCLLIESYCMNFYCSYLWCDFSKIKLSKIRVAYNNIYRQILGYGRRDSASNMFVTNRIDTFEARMRKAYFRFIQRLNGSSNNIIKCFASNSWIRSNYLWKRWDSTLYISYNKF
jgi:hypothetical protein